MQSEFLALEQFFNDPVTRSIYDSPVALNWLISDEPEPLPDPSMSFVSYSTSQNFTINQTPRRACTPDMKPPTPLTKVPQSAQLAFDPENERKQYLHAINEHDQCQKIKFQQQQQEVSPDVIRAFINMKTDYLANTSNIVTHLVDGVALGFVYDTDLADNNKLQDIQLPEDVPVDTVPISKRWAAVLHNHDCTTMAVAKYPGGSCLIKTGRTDYRNTCVILNYYVLTDFPRAIPQKSMVIYDSYERVVINGKQRYRDKFGNPISPTFMPIYSKGIAGRETNLVMFNTILLEKQCYTCTMLQNHCYCPTHTKKSLPCWYDLPSKLKHSYPTTIHHFLTKMNTIINGSFWTTINIRTTSVNFYFEGLSDISNSVRKLQGTDYIKIVYPNEIVQSIFRPTIREGLSMLSFSNHNEQLASPEDADVTIQKEHIEDILRDPTKFFVKMTIITTKIGKRISEFSSSSAFTDNSFDFADTDFPCDINVSLVNSKNLITLQLEGPVDPTPITSTLIDTLVPLGTLHSDAIAPEAPPLNSVPLDITPLDTAPLNSFSFSQQTDFLFNPAIPFKEESLLQNPSSALFSVVGNEKPSTNEISQACVNNVTDKNIMDGISSNGTNRNIWDTISDINNDMDTTDSSFDLSSSLLDSFRTAKSKDEADFSPLIQNVESKMVKDSMKNGGARIPCPHCSSSFKAPWHLTEHIKFVHNRVKNHLCHLCEAKFARKGDRNKHIRILHEKLRKYRCNDCGMLYTYKADLERHRKKTCQK